jgi:hypothetical protein
LGLFDDLFGSDKKKSQQAFGLFSFMNEQQKENNKYTDEELDNCGLEDYEKEEVKKGNYDPWNFEEEELDEDDYYYEDDN